MENASEVPRSRLPTLVGGLGVALGVGALALGFDATGGLSRGCGGGGYVGAKADVGYFFMATGLALAVLSSRVLARRRWAAFALGVLLCPFGLFLLSSLTSRRGVSPLVAVIGLVVLATGVAAVFAGKALGREAVAPGP